MWQWNSQLPGRSAFHVIRIVPPVGINCVTTRCAVAGSTGAALMPSPSSSISK